MYHHDSLGGRSVLRTPLLRTPLARRSSAEALFVLDPEPSSEVTVGSKKTAVEGLDFEVVESEEAAVASRLSLAETLHNSAVKWATVLIVGTSVAWIAFFINLSVENINGQYLAFTIHLIKQNRPALAFLAYVSASLSLITFAAALCSFMRPTAAGSGIPEVKAYLNGVDLPDIFKPGTILVKIAGTISSVAGGLALGKEGPLVHIGAAVAYQLSKLMAQLIPAATKGLGGKPKYVNNLDSDMTRTEFVTVGAGAGVTAAFNCPIAGVLFAVEELTSWWRKPLIWKSLFTNAVCAIVLTRLSKFCEGEGGKANPVCGSFGGGGYIHYQYEAMAPFTYHDVAAGALVGFFGGILGAVFNRAFLIMASLRARYILPYGSGARVLEAALIALLTASVNFSLPFLTSCSPCPPEALCPSASLTGQYVQYTCGDGFYNDMAGLAPVTNDNAIKNLFNSPDSVFGYQTLLLFLPAFFILAVLTNGVAIPAGLFIPLILTGASMGRLFGKFLNDVFGAQITLANGTFALLGAAGMLGGSMRAVVWLSVKILEVTGNLILLPLVILVMTVAKETADFFSDGIIDTIYKQKKLPILEYPPPSFLKDLMVHDVVRGQVVAFNGVESVARIVSVLQTTTHNAFPVLDEKEDPLVQGTLYGVILRSKLLELLNIKAFQRRAKCKSRALLGGVAPHELHTLQTESRRSLEASSSLSSEENFGLSDTDLGKFVDLHPYCNTSPYVVPESMTLRKAYSLFRLLALRHLCIVKNQLSVVGMLTRKDLLPGTWSGARIANDMGESKHLDTESLNSWNHLEHDN